MLKIYICIIFHLFALPLFSQTKTISYQDFDETNPGWDFTTDIPFFDNNADGFYGIHNGDLDADLNDTGNAINSNKISHTNILNDFLFINDLNDEGEHGTNDKATITFDKVDISKYHHVEISFDYDVIAFDNSDYIIYQMIEDGEITKSDTLPKNDQGNITKQVFNKTKILHFKLLIKQNGVDEFAAIDNIQLQGVEIVPCVELMISEYVEGTSSGTSYRNNFIEIYNPTGTDINLDSYNLVKYTGKNPDPSSTLNLNGVIAAYGNFVIEDVTENLGVNANLSSNSLVMDFTGDDKIALRKLDKIIDLIGHIGDSVDFAKNLTLRRKSHIQNPNNEYEQIEWDVYALENVNNINAHVSMCSGIIPEIQITGNSIEIIDESMSTSSFNNTFFGDTDITQNNNITKTFIIKNIGNDILDISKIEITGTNASAFILENIVTSQIAKNDSIAFDINFKPSSIGLKTAMVHITNNDASENPYNFTIQGEGSGLTQSPLLISQYYEGEGNNKWIEITNISDFETPDHTYYLALYRNLDAQSPVGIKPTIQKLIPRTSVGEVLKYSASLNVNTPSYAIDGNEIKTNICTFDGNDIIIISTTNDETCWENKIDRIGNSSNWGEDKSFVRKYGCDKALPKTGFSIDDWLVFQLLEINSATAGYNLRIGEHYTGPTIFTTNNEWSNGLPDKYRNIIINHEYNADLQGNIEACELTINAEKTVNIHAGHYLRVQNDMLVNGTLHILDKGSLLMTNNAGKVIDQGNIHIHKTTTTLKKHDYTYWSSPLKNAILEEVFAASPQNSFYEFHTQNFMDSDNDGYDDDENAWIRASANMEIGKGYTAMAPNTDPFENKQSVVFNGNVNNGELSIPVFLSKDPGNEDDDWNLIGNPYPSAINANLFLHDENNKNTIHGTIYFWTHDTAVKESKYSANDYAMYTVGTGGIAASTHGITPTEHIASCQGFFVEAKKEGTVNFTNAMREANKNEHFFKNDARQKLLHTEKDTNMDNKIWLNLYNDQGVFSQILLGFIDGATDDFESHFDGLRLIGSNYLSFFSMRSNRHLAIQGTAPFRGDETIALGIHSKIEENVSLLIGIDHMQGNFNEQDIYLFDKELHITHNLRKGDYAFTVQKTGFISDRFSIAFSKSTLGLKEDTGHKDTLLIKNRNDMIQLSTTNNKLLSSLQIFDILGRKLIEVHTNSYEISILKSALTNPGIYLVRVKLEDSRILTTKFFK